MLTWQLSHLRYVTDNIVLTSQVYFARSDSH